MKSIVVSVNIDKKGYQDVVWLIRSWADKNNVSTTFLYGYEELTKAPKDTWQKADLVLSIGGDGTFLATGRIIGRHETPILGINYGTLGFLTEISIDNILPTLDTILAGNFEIEKRVTLECLIYRKDKLIHDMIALNDIVINKGTHNKLIELDISVDDTFVISMFGDGLIISTPTGSTAYSLSAGGPVVYPTLNAMVITGVCPHTLSMRPLVVSEKSEIEIKVNSVFPEPIITNDGFDHFNLLKDDRIIVKNSRYYVNIVRCKHLNFYETLRKKLFWGQRKI